MVFKFKHAQKQKISKRLEANQPVGLNHIATPYFFLHNGLQMPNPRNVLLVNNQTYHVLNRAIASEEIFAAEKGLQRALKLLDYYRFSQSISFSKFKKLSLEDRNRYLVRVKNPRNLLVEIYAFSLMPDHFHLLLKQLKDRGISIFLSNFQNGYAKYYNLLNERDGGLFKSPFKAKLIDTDEKFLHVSRYIHLNPVTSYMIEFKNLKNYPHTSFPYYLGLKDDDLINTGFLIKIMGSRKKYEEFVANQVDYQRKLQQIKRLTLEL